MLDSALGKFADLVGQLMELMGNLRRVAAELVSLYQTLPDETAVGVIEPFLRTMIQATQKTWLKETSIVTIGTIGK